MKDGGQNISCVSSPSEMHKKAEKEGFAISRGFPNHKKRRRRDSTSIPLLVSARPEFPRTLTADGSE